VRVTFVNMRREMYPLLGACYMSAYVKQTLASVETSLVELVVNEDLHAAARKILALDPDVVGITTFTVGYYDTMALCGILKSIKPDVQVWLGGAHITSVPHTLPTGADLGIIGEGEETFLELCRLWENEGGIPANSLSEIKGICYRDGSDIRVTERRGLISPLDSIPPPDLSILDMDWYIKEKKFFLLNRYLRGFVLLTSRGCPYDCRFCQAAVQWGKCRYNSAERVVSEIEALRRKYRKINAINIIDDLFIGSIKRLREIVRLIREKKLHDGIVFNINGRANLINEEVLELLKSINVIQISYGFESASERVLSYLKGGTVTVEHNFRAAELTNGIGMGVGGQFMLGTPGETEQDILSTIDFIRRNPMSHAHLSVTTPLPGTVLWQDCKQKGLVSDDMDWRKLDFGLPDNPSLIYVNDDSVPKEKFTTFVKDAQEACARWNPKPTIRDYLGYLELMSLREFIRKGARKLLRLLK